MDWPTFTMELLLISATSIAESVIDTVGSGIVCPRHVRNAGFVDVKSGITLHRPMLLMGCTPCLAMLLMGCTPCLAMTDQCI